jgi:CRP-like cAMP-binding protein
MTDRIDHDAVYNVLFANLRISSVEDSYKLREFSRRFVFKTYAPGDELWSLQSTEGDLQVILTGAFGEYLKEQDEYHLLRFYRKGKCTFSEDLLIYSQPAETIAKCLVEGVVASIPRAQILHMSEGNDFGPRLISGLINLSMTEYHHTTYEMLQTSVESRIKAALEQFPELLNVIPRKELADYLGISRASLFRTLKMFGDEK